MYTSSLGFPSMFDTARNRVGVLEDGASVVNRTRLLILTDPTEVYNEPDQGVGISKYMWKYNNENNIAILKDNIIDQLVLHEPCVDAQETQFSDGLLFTGENREDPDSFQSLQILEQTIGLVTTFGEKVNVKLNDNTNQPVHS